jgi:hypothetical protein
MWFGYMIINVGYFSFLCFHFELHWDQLEMSYLLAGTGFETHVSNELVMCILSFCSGIG